MKALYKEKLEYLKEILNTESYTASIAKVLLGTIALFAASQIIIPIKPVPITLQTIIISMIGLTYSPRLSFFTVVTYIMAGIVGLPMFSKFSSGFSYFIGPTGGYIIGFLIAAPLMSFLRNFFSTRFTGIIACCFLAHFVIYALGVSWLATFISFKEAVYSGLIIYIPTGIGKIIIFSYLFSYIKNKNNQL